MIGNIFLEKSSTIARQNKEILKRNFEQTEASDQQNPPLKRRDSLTVHSTKELSELRNLQEVFGYFNHQVVEESLWLSKMQTQRLLNSIMDLTMRELSSKEKVCTNI